MDLRAHADIGRPGVISVADGNHQDHRLNVEAHLRVFVSSCATILVNLLAIGFWLCSVSGSRVKGEWQPGERNGEARPGHLRSSIHETDSPDPTSP